MNLIDNISKVYDEDPEELIGRYVTNSMGVQEIVELRQIQWDYLEWLIERGANIERFIRNCDKRNPDKPLSVSLQCWVFWLYQEREKIGLPRPEWLEVTTEY